MGISRRCRTSLRELRQFELLSADVGRCPTTLVWTHLMKACSICILYQMVPSVMSKFIMYWTNSSASSLRTHHYLIMAYHDMPHYTCPVVDKTFITSIISNGVFCNEPIHNASHKLIICKVVSCKVVNSLQACHTKMHLKADIKYLIHI